MKIMIKPNLLNCDKKNSESSMPKNNQLAAIYVSQSAKREVSVAKQIVSCQKFLSDKDMQFSGDLFMEKEGMDYIVELIRARALSRRFDYLVSFLLCPSESKGFSMGVIVGWKVENFLGNSQAKTALKE